MHTVTDQYKSQRVATQSLLSSSYWRLSQISQPLAWVLPNCLAIHPKTSSNSLAFRHSGLFFFCENSIQFFPLSSFMQGPPLKVTRSNLSWKCQQVQILSLCPLSRFERIKLSIVTVSPCLISPGVVEAVQWMSKQAWGEVMLWEGSSNSYLFLLETVEQHGHSQPYIHGDTHDRRCSHTGLRSQSFNRGYTNSHLIICQSSQRFRIQVNESNIFIKITLNQV